MKKLLSIAVAAAAVIAAPAHATIDFGWGQGMADNSEALFFAWSPTLQASYVQDLGLTVGSLMANPGQGFSANVQDAYAPLAGANDLRWAVVAFGIANSGDFAPGAEKLLTTVQANKDSATTWEGMISDDLDNARSYYINYIPVLNSLAGHSVANGSSYATAAQPFEYLLGSRNPQTNLNGKLPTTYGNPVNVDSSFWYITSGDEFDITTPVLAERLVTTWRFDGTTVSTVTAVPEPASVALMLAGLGTVGLLVARRRG